MERFWSKVKKSNNCWEWISAKTEAGYGEFYYKGKPVYAHRLSYELLIGEIPDGLHIDHLCRNRGCVNPEHLEPVKQGENLRRGEHVNQNKFKTHCVHGHEFNEKNTMIRRRPNRKPSRECLVCLRTRYNFS